MWSVLVMWLWHNYKFSILIILAVYSELVKLCVCLAWCWTLVETSVSKIIVCVMVKSSSSNYQWNPFEWEKVSALWIWVCKWHALSFNANSGMVLDVVDYDSSLYILFIIHSHPAIWVFIMYTSDIQCYLHQETLL